MIGMEKSVRLKWVNVPSHDILVLMAYATNEGSGGYAHPHNPARVFTARNHKVWLFGLSIFY